eukprot:13956693-Alexandrium_andersonii.AAC.1
MFDAVDSRRLRASSLRASPAGCGRSDGQWAVSHRGIHASVTLTIIAAFRRCHRVAVASTFHTMSHWLHRRARATQCKP